MKTPPRWLTSIALATVLSGCIKVGPTRQAAPDPAEQVEQFLAGRAKRLTLKDAEGYLKGLSAEARAFEQPLALGALGVPIEHIELKLANASSFEAANTKSVRVSFLYRYQGLPDDNVFRYPLIYDLVSDGKGWLVTASKAEDDALTPPWMKAPVQTQRSEHFLAMFRPGSVDASKALALAEQARAQLAPKLTFPLEASYLILLAKDRAEYEALAARASPVSAIGQAETSYEVTPEAIKVQSRQMVVNMQKLLEDRTEVETFQHELGHLALAKDTRPFTPAWVSESAAMYLADTKPVSLWRLGTRQGRFKKITFAELSSSTTLGEHDPTGEAASYEYAYSAAAAYSLVQEYGAEKYWSFYRSFAEVPATRFYEGLPSDRIANEREESVRALAIATTSEGLKATFGIDEKTLDEKVRAWIRLQR